MDVTTYLRDEYHLHNPALVLGAAGAGDAQTPITVAFLMPCHSTPWRSRLVYPGIRAWALTCEPPINMTPERRAGYIDEADEFYVDPKQWLARNMNEPEWRTEGGDGSEAGEEAVGARRVWPQYVVFFEQLEPTVREVLAGTGYAECWRGFNSHFHDDWRRRGDVVVWCVDLGLRTVLEVPDFKDAIMNQPLPLRSKADGE